MKTPPPTATKSLAPAVSTARWFGRCFHVVCLIAAVSHIQGADADLVGHYVGGNTVGNVLKDASGAGADMELVGAAQPETGEEKPSIVFDGSSNFLRSKQPVSNLSDFTFMAWVKPRNVQGAWERGAVNRCVILMSESLLLTFNGGQLLFQELVSSPDMYRSVSDVSVFQNDAWYHIALAKSGTDIKLYVNGEMTVTGDLPEFGQAVLADKGTILVGYHNDERFSGEMNDIKVFRQALPPERIAEEFTATSANYPR